MKINLSKIWLILGILLFVQVISAQTEEQDDGLSQREVVSNAFTKNRPTAKSQAPKRYRKGVVRKPRRKKPLNYKRPAKTEPVQQFGVTMWRLRNEKTGDTGARLLTQGAGSGTKFVAERVPIKTFFRAKDKVRLSFESPVAGYLYVFDREIGKGCQITNGDLSENCRLGEPYMIFPTLSTRNGDNSVKPGNLIEIPAQTDDPFYFDITPSSEDYIGEYLTVIVSPTKLDGLEAQNGPVKIASSLIEKWEDDWEEDFAADELEGDVGLYSNAEKNAGAGKNLLNQADPPPQTRFAFKITKGKPFLISFPLLVEN